MKAWLLLKVFLWIVGVCIAIVVTCYLVIRFVNRHDRPPSASVVRFEELSRSLPALADKDNGYIYFMGFNADKGADPASVGMRRIAWVKERMGRPDSPSTAQFPDQTHDIRGDRSAEFKELFEKCREVDRNCVRALVGSEAKIEQWLKREDWLAQRYTKLRSYPQWREILEYDERMPSAPFAGVYEAQKILLLNAWLRAGRGDAVGVKKLLEEDIHFWRRNLVVNDILISKMISARALRQHFAWSNLILRRLSAGKVADTIPSAWRLPISDAERSMLRPLMGEWRYFTSTLKRVKSGAASDLGEPGHWFSDSAPVLHLADKVLLVQDASNQYAERLAAIADGLAVSYEQLPAAVKRISRTGDDAPMFANGLYNMFGNVLVRAGGWDMTKYARTLADIEGVRRATLLAAELRRRQIPAQQVDEQLAVSSPGSPYDGRPFAWDGVAQSIVFTGLGEGKFARTPVLY